MLECLSTVNENERFEKDHPLSLLKVLLTRIYLLNQNWRMLDLNQKSLTQLLDLMPLCLILLVVQLKMADLLHMTRIQNGMSPAERPPRTSTAINVPPAGQPQSLKSWRSENHTPHYYWLNQSK